MYILPTDESICSGIYTFRCILVSCIVDTRCIETFGLLKHIKISLYNHSTLIMQLCASFFDKYGYFMVTKNHQILNITSFIVEKQLKRIVIDAFLDLMRHLLLEIEITCNRGLSGFHWK